MEYQVEANGVERFEVSTAMMRTLAGRVVDSEVQPTLSQQTGHKADNVPG